MRNKFDHLSRQNGNCNTYVEICTNTNRNRNYCNVFTADALKIIYVLKLQSNLVITRSSGGIFWDRGISEARYRFCSQVFFF